MSRHTHRNLNILLVFLSKLVRLLVHFNIDLFLAVCLVLSDIALNFLFRPIIRYQDGFISFSARSPR